MVKYFSHIPQAERPRTLMLFYDCRHYMPGAERAFATQDYATSHPDVYKQVIAAMGIEHLGQIKVEEGDGKPYHKTGLSGNVVGLGDPNQHLVDIAIEAVKDNHLPAYAGASPGPQGHSRRRARPVVRTRRHRAADRRRRALPRWAR